MGDEKHVDDTESRAPDQAPGKVIPSKKIPSKRTRPRNSSKKTSSKSNKQGIQIPEKVDIVWTVALVVAAFVVGFFVRGALEPSKAMDASLSPMMQGNPADVSSSQSQGGGMSAPALEESQLDQGMPSGHPNIDDQGNVVDENGTENSKSDVPAAGSPEGKSVDVKEDPNN